MSASDNDQLDRIERLVGALLAISVDRHLREYPDLGAAKSRKIEHILSSGGMNGREIAKVLGKTPQAVSQNLSK